MDNLKSGWVSEEQRQDMSPMMVIAMINYFLEKWASLPASIHIFQAKPGWAWAGPRIACSNGASALRRFSV